MLTNDVIMDSHLASVIDFNNNGNLTIIKSYEGRIDQEIVKDFTEEIEKLFDSTDNEFKTNKKVFHVMVEMLQNVCKHSETDGEKVSNIGKGAFVLASDDTNYYVRVGNISKNEDADNIIKKLDEFNPISDSPDDLKIKYRELIKASRISEKGGAGLGLIDIIKKTKNKIDYLKTPIDANLSYFIQQSTVEIV